MRNMSEGLMTGGIECAVHHYGCSRQVETVFDLPTWIKSQFSTLREIVSEHHQEGESRPGSYCLICVGSDQNFAALSATLSKYEAFFMYLERPSDRSIINLPNINQISIVVSRRALQYLSANERSGMHSESQLAALYAKFAEEDRALAEEGLTDYAVGLKKEDVSG